MYLDAGGRRLDHDPPELGHRRHEIAEEGTLFRRAVVDQAARPHVGLEHLVGAHRQGVEEAGVHGRVAADPHRQQPIFCLRSGPVAPWDLVRQSRAVVYGAADPATSPVNNSGRRHVILPPRHHAWRGTDVSPRHGNRRSKKC